MAIWKVFCLVGPKLHCLTILIFSLCKLTDDKRDNANDLVKRLYFWRKSYFVNKLSLWRRNPTLTLLTCACGFLFQCNYSSTFPMLRLTEPFQSNFSNIFVPWLTEKRLRFVNCMVIEFLRICLNTVLNDFTAFCGDTTPWNFKKKLKIKIFIN